MDKDLFKQEFATRLFNIIEEKQISRVELAGKAEIAYASLASYLAAQTVGKGALPPLDAVVRLAAVLGVSTDYLLCGQQTIAAPPKQSAVMPLQRDAQKLLHDLYTVVTALNLRAEVQENGDIAFFSSNQFLRMFFEQLQRGDTPEVALAKFSDLRVSKGTLMDPVTYRLLHGEEGEK